MKNKFPKSIRKYIRSEKARIRREVFDFKKQTELINELYLRLLEKKKPKTKEEPKEKPKEKPEEKSKTTTKKPPKTAKTKK